MRKVERNNAPKGRGREEDWMNSGYTLSQCSDSAGRDGFRKKMKNTHAKDTLPLPLAL